MYEPKDTISYLNKLEAKGFNDDHFRLIHFKENETINSHRNYAKGISEFKKDSRNMIVCYRLSFIASYIKFVDDPICFSVLAKVAVKEIRMPKPKGQGFVFTPS